MPAIKKKKTSCSSTKFAHTLGEGGGGTREESIKTAIVVVVVVIFYLVLFLTNIPLSIAPSLFSPPLGMVLSAGENEYNLGKHHLWGWSLDHYMGGGVSKLARPTTAKVANNWVLIINF